MKIIDKFLNEERSFEKKNSVKALIQSEHGILILRRQNDQSGGGKWDLPGGCIESGESENDALKREVYEETGLTIFDIKKKKDITLKIPETGINSTMKLYMTKTSDDDVKLKPANWKGSDNKPEHTEYRWISTREELENLPMLDQLKSVILDVLK